MWLPAEEKRRLQTAWSLSKLEKRLGEIFRRLAIDDNYQPQSKPYSLNLETEVLLALRGNDSLKINTNELKTLLFSNRFPRLQQLLKVSHVAESSIANYIAAISRRNQARYPLPGYWKEFVNGFHFRGRGFVENRNNLLLWGSRIILFPLWLVSKLVFIVSSKFSEVHKSTEYYFISFGSFSYPRLAYFGPTHAALSFDKWRPALTKASLPFEWCLYVLQNIVIIFVLYLPVTVIFGLFHLIAASIDYAYAYNKVKNAERKKQRDANKTIENFVKQTEENNKKNRLALGVLTKKGLPDEILNKIGYHLFHGKQDLQRCKANVDQAVKQSQVPAAIKTMISLLFHAGIIGYKNYAILKSKDKMQQVINDLSLEKLLQKHRPELPTTRLAAMMSEVFNKMGVSWYKQTLADLKLINNAGNSRLTQASKITQAVIRIFNCSDRLFIHLDVTEQKALFDDAYNLIFKSYRGKQPSAETKSLPTVAVNRAKRACWLRMTKTMFRTTLLASIVDCDYLTLNKLSEKYLEAMKFLTILVRCAIPSYEPLLNQKYDRFLKKKVNDAILFYKKRMHIITPHLLAICGLMSTDNIGQELYNSIVESPEIAAMDLSVDQLNTIKKLLIPFVTLFKQRVENPAVEESVLTSCSV